MVKNVIVLDEFNKQTGTTYPKRARGLVKSGRAEFIDDGTIRLRHSPSAENDKSERMDELMSNNAQTIEKDVNIKAVQANVETLKKEAEAAIDKVNDATGEIAEMPVTQNSSAEKVALAVAERAGQLISVIEKADTAEKVAAIVNMTNLLDDTVKKSLKVCVAEALGLADIAAAVKELSKTPSAGHFAAGIATRYFQAVEQINGTAEQVNG